MSKQNEGNEEKKPPAVDEFTVGEDQPFQPMSKERLIGELFTEKDLERKTEIPNVFNQTALEILAYHLSDAKGKAKMFPEMAHKKVIGLGDMLGAWIYRYKNNAISHARMSRAEYITALQGVGESNEEELKKKRQLESIIGV